MAASDALRETAKSLGLMQHKDKSDSELQQILLNNARIVAGLGTDPRSVAQGYQLLGEVDACNEILSQRKAERDEIKSGKKKWVEELQKRKDDALLTLRAAATPNGQLVQAILEDEDSMSQAELSGWCDELSVLDDEELSKLLKDLVADGVLEDPDKDGRYRLRVVCDESQQWSAGAVDRFVERSHIVRKAISRVLFHILLIESEPMCAQECVEEVEFYDDLLQDNGLNQDSFSEFSVDATMKELMKEGILTRAFTVNRKAYYAPAIIGEGGHVK